MSALDELREGLREAARRDVEARRVRRRRHRRATGAIAVVLLGGAAAATATDLISVGEEVSDPVGQTAAYRAAGGEPVQIAVQADSGGELPFAVGVYDGQQRRTLRAGRLAPRPSARRGPRRHLPALRRRTDRRLPGPRAAGVRPGTTRRPRAGLRPRRRPAPARVRVKQTGDTVEPGSAARSCSSTRTCPRATRS